MGNLNRVSFSLYGFIFLLSGCLDHPANPVEADDHPSLSFSIQDLAREGRNPERVWSELAAGAIPGFAGVHLDEDGTFVVSSTKATSEAASVEYVETWRSRTFHPSAPIRFRKVDFDFRELVAGRDNLTGFLADGIVTMLDVNEAENVLLVGVPPGGGQIDASRFAGLTGLPEKAIKIVETYGARPDETLLQTIRPTVGGQQIQAEGTSPCSLGFHTILDGDTLFATASHCSQTIASLDSAAFEQSASGEEIGFEVWDVEPHCHYISFAGVFCSCGGPGCRGSDLQLSEYHDTVSFEFGRIAQTLWPSTSQSSGSATFDDPPYHNIAEKRPASSLYMGLDVDKVGYASGWTRGEITGTWVMTAIYLDETHVLTTVGQMKASYYRTGGDSGAPVFIPITDNQVALIGIHSGGATDGDAYFSTVDGIEYDLQDTLAVVGDPLLTVGISGPTSISSQGNYTWSANVSGGNGTYSYEWYRRTDYWWPRSSPTCHYQTSWTLVGTNSSYSDYVRLQDLDFDLLLTVYSGDDIVQVESDAIDVLVGDGSQACPEGG